MNATMRKARRPGGPWASTAVAVGIGALAVLALESALLPGLALGVAAGLAPRLWPRPQRSKQTPAGSLRRRQAGFATAVSTAPVWRRLQVKRAVLKTITFRVIVATLDFSVNYIVLGDLTVAAGLSTFSLVAGPFFYFLHESIWSWLEARRRDEGLSPDTLHIAGLTMSRALAKTITFRVMASTAEFTTNFVVVGDFATAVLLSSFGFVLGPFVYYAHERVWERFGDAVEPAAPPRPVLRLTYAGA